MNIKKRISESKVNLPLDVIRNMKHLTRCKPGHKDRMIALRGGARAKWYWGVSRYDPVEYLD